MSGLVVTLGFGLPWVAVLVVVAAGFDRLLRASERRGWWVHRRSWSTVGVGNALLEFHVSFEPQRARIETQLAMEQPEPGGRVGEPPVVRVGRGSRPDATNVIAIDFVRRRRRS